MIRPHLFLMLLAACGPGHDGTTPSTAITCVRTEALDEPRDCVIDDDCACGAHCDFSACTYDCRADTDCSDGHVCDVFGRCSAPGEAIPAVQAEGEAGIVLDPPVIEVLEGVPYVVRLAAAGPRTDTLRLVARGGAQVWCPGAEDATASCELRGIPSDGVLFSVAFNAEESDGAPSVDVLAATGRLASLGVVPRAPSDAVQLDGERISGVYAGSARLSAGGGLWSPVDLPGAEDLAAQVRHAMAATVVLDDGLTGSIRLDDPTGAVLPMTPITVAVDRGVARWPALAWLRIGGAVEAITAPVHVPLAVSEGGLVLDVPLDLPDMPLGDLRLNLVRGPDLPTGFVPGSATPDAVATLPAPPAALSAGAAFDGIAALYAPNPPVGLLVSGPWASGPVCVDDLDVAAVRGAAIPAACDAARSSNELYAPVQCPTVTAELHASDDLGGARFDCAYDVEAPVIPWSSRCRGLNAWEGLYAWNECLTEQTSGGAGCRFDDEDPTGPARECASGWCDEGRCTEPAAEQLIDYCATWTCGATETEVRRIDHCAAAQAATGCEVRPVVGAPTEPASSSTLRQATLVPADPELLEAGDVLVVTLSETTVRECVIPEVTRDRQCAAAALCANTPATLDPAGLSGGADLNTGDVLCDRGASPAALPLPLRGFALDPDDLDAAACAADLTALAGLAADPGVSEAMLTEETVCLSPGRLVAALDVSLRSLRRIPEPTGLGLAHRLVQQVVEVQALVARDATDAFRQRITFDGDDDARPALDQLDQSLAAWAFVLDPRVTAGLMAMPPELLAAPDPRPALGITPDPDASAGIRQGLSVSLVEALVDQLDVLDLALERAWLDGSASAIADRRARIGGVLRTGGVVIAFAEAMHDRAAAAGPLEWEEAWQFARLGWVNRVRGLNERGIAIDDGRNPLGIEDVDTPLFFVGDVDGDRERFTAVSRSLIGTGPGDPRALAPVAVRIAQEALAVARSDWRSNLSNAAESARRQDDIIRRYGELITGYCGAPIDDPNFDIGTYNVLDQPVDVETCFVEPACREASEVFEETLGAADLGYQLCVATRAGVAVSPADDPELAAALDGLAAPLSAAAVGDGPFPLAIVALQRDGLRRSAVIRVAGAEIVVPVNDLGQIGADLSPSLMGGAAAERVSGIVAGCEAARQRTLQLRPTISPTSCSLADDCALRDVCSDHVCVSGGRPDVLDDVGCYYDGAISEQALAVRSAGLEIEAARAELDAYAERYDIARRGCALLAGSAAEQQALLSKHNELMLGLDIARTVATSVAIAAYGVADCALAAAAMDTTMPWSAAISGGGAAVACGSVAVGATAEIVAEGLEAAMSDVERQHEEAVLAAQNDADQRQCMNEASLELVGAKAQTLRIRQARQAQAAAVINLRGQKSYTAGLWADGNAALQKELRIAKDAAIARSVLSDAAERYLERFRYAQRLTYLSIRAIENELQRTETQARQAVIGASTPNELEEVLTSLSRTLNNGAIAGSQPTGLLAVLSLREHLLQLADTTTSPVGEQTLTSEERFRLLLSAPAYAVVDDQGRYLGQQIPFSLAPLGAFGLGGNTAGIPIVAQNDCAERLWSVNAAVIGGADLFDGSNSSLTRIDLLQRNTFASQRCAAGGDPLIVTTARPSMNLLDDPMSITSQNPAANAVDQFARGLMQPYLNISRAELEAESFSQGATTQLAGRGLYGDYALFIPAAALSVDGGPGLRLDAVDDILLRFDYVAAAR